MKVDSRDGIRIERAELAGCVVRAVDRYAIQQKQVLVARASVDVQPARILRVEQHAVPCKRFEEIRFRKPGMRAQITPRDASCPDPAIEIGSRL